MNWGFEKKPEEIKCANCVHFTELYELCCYSMGDEDYDCRGREYKSKKKEIKEND